MTKQKTYDSIMWSSEEEGREGERKQASIFMWIIVVILIRLGLTSRSIEKQPWLWIIMKHSPSPFESLITCPNDKGRSTKKPKDLERSSPRTFSSVLIHLFEKKYVCLGIVLSFSHTHTLSLSPLIIEMRMFNQSHVWFIFTYLIFGPKSIVLIFLPL